MTLDRKFASQETLTCREGQIFPHSAGLPIGWTVSTENWAPRLTPWPLLLVTREQSPYTSKTLVWDPWRPQNEFWLLQQPLHRFLEVVTHLSPFGAWGPISTHCWELVTHLDHQLRPGVYTRFSRSWSFGNNFSDPATLSLYPETN